MASDSRRRSSANIEFLEFLADISHPATGKISPCRLASTLRQTEADLDRKWRKRGADTPWSIFAGEILAVLDAAHDQVFDLMVVIDWYLDTPIAGFGMETPQQLVVGGKARQLVVAIKAKKVQLA